MHNTYVSADSSKVLTKGITSYSEIRNIISNFRISVIKDMACLDRKVELSTN